MSLTAKQWEGMKELIHPDNQKAAIKIWNEAMKIVQAHTRSEAAPATALSEDQIKSFKIDILESLILEIRRTGKPYTNDLHETPEVLRT